MKIIDIVYEPYSESGDIAVCDLASASDDQWRSILDTLKILTLHNKKLKEDFLKFCKSEGLMTAEEFKKSIDKNVVFKNEYIYWNNYSLKSLSDLRSDYDMECFIKGGEHLYVEVSLPKNLQERVDGYKKRKEEERQKRAERKKKKEIEKAKKILDEYKVKE